jgi:hypothetical protein
MYKKLFILAVLQCLSLLAFAQTITVVDSISRKKVYEFKVIVAKEISSESPQYLDTLWATKKGTIEIKKKYKTLSGIIYYIVSHPDYREKKVEQWQTKEVTVPLVRNGISEEYCIKLFTLRDTLNSDQKKQWENTLKVKGIKEVKRKDGRFDYTIAPMKNLYKNIDQLERIKATKNPEVKDCYLLFEKTHTKVHFRIQFAVAHDWMEEEFRTPRDLLENRYSLAQIQTDDKLHRVVSVKTYTNYGDAVKDFSEKVRVRISNKKTVIIACTKIGKNERVITSMNL